MRPVLSLLLSVLGMVAAALPAAAEKRVALVVGNSAYRNVAPLDNPKNDAALMAETLRGLGFALVGGSAQLDLDKAGLDAAVQVFGAQLQGADVALFYYAGHGIQLRGANYLVPVDANPTKEADVDFQMLDSNTVLRQMESAGSRLNLAILDACRNNPFGGRGLRATDSGLAQMRAPEGTLISFATQPGSVRRSATRGHTATLTQPAALAQARGSRYDRETGQLLTGSLLDYAVPHADSLPKIRSQFQQTPSPTNPLGVKGIGESGAIGAPPTIVHAVLDALAPFGIAHLDMPLTPQKIWAAIQQARGRASS